MKRIIIVFVALIWVVPMLSQENGTYHNFNLKVDGLNRIYRLYVPDGYKSNETWPMILNFHALGHNRYNQIEISKMNEVADTAKFLIVYPQGLPVVFKTIF